MSVIVFELKEEHVKLLKHLRWSVNKDNIISNVNISDIDNEVEPPFGENNIYEAIDLILNGRPADFNPLNEEEIKVYSTEQKEAWDNLYNQLPLALDVILANGHFELGTYRSRWHVRDWKKVTN